MFTVGGLVLACAATELPGDENGFKFYDQEAQAIFIDKLKSERIFHRVRGDGTVVYSAQDEEKVSKLRKTVLNEGFVPSAQVSDEALENAIIKRLKNEHIKFAVKEKGGKRWISWTDKDDVRVQNIMKNVEAVDEVCHQIIPESAVSQYFLKSIRESGIQYSLARSDVVCFAERDQELVEKLSDLAFKKLPQQCQQFDDRKRLPPFMNRLRSAGVSSWMEKPDGPVCYLLKDARRVRDLVAETSK